MTQPYLFDFFESGGRGAGIEAALARWERRPEPAKPLEVNPYRGCGFAGCLRLGEAGPGIRSGPAAADARAGIVGALRRALDSGRAAGRTLALGTRGDPYQPLEAELGLSGRILDLLARRSGLTVRLRTKSPLLTRDLELLQRAARRNRLCVEVPLMSLDQRLAAVLEPEAPPAAERLLLLRELSRNGIDAGLLIAPVVPGLTDSLANLESLLRTARRCGARFAEWSPLVLEPAPPEAKRRCPLCPTGLLLDRLRSIAPDLAERLQRIHLGHRQAPSFYKRLIATRMRELKLKYGFGEPDGAVFSSPVHPCRNAQAGPPAERRFQP